MRFSKCVFKPKPRAVNNRRLAAAQKAAEKERESWGLFKDIIDVATAEERIEKHDKEYVAWAKIF